VGWGHAAALSRARTIRRARKFPEPAAAGRRLTGNATDRATPPARARIAEPGRSHAVFHAALNLVRPAALLLAATVATACVGTAGASEPTRSAVPTPKPNPDRVVFRVDWDGGFVAPGTILGRLPQIVVYADGRVIVQGPQIEIYPGPLVPSLQVRALTPEALARLVQLAKDKGLLKDAHYDLAGIADATTTVLTLDIDGRTYRVSAYALMEAGDAAVPGFGGMDEATRAGRAALREFIDGLSGIPEADFSGPWTVFEPTALRLFAAPAGQRPDDVVQPGGPVAWPLADLGRAGAPVGDGSLGFRCQVVAGDDLATVLPLLQSSNALSVFTSGGGEWSLIVRPLLPGETGC
jgi:hypothetical protein